MGWLAARKVVGRWVETGTIHDVRKGPTLQSRTSRHASYVQVSCRFVPDSQPDTSFHIKRLVLTGPLAKAGELLSSLRSGDKVEVEMIRRRNGKVSANSIVQNLSLD